MNDETRIYLLIAKSLRNDISEKEAQDLDEWINDEANHETYKRLKELWEEIPESYFLSSSNKEDDWNAISGRFDTIRNFRKRYWVAAAVILFTIGLSGWFAFKMNRDEIIYQTFNSAKEFVLPDHSVVNLNRNSSLILHNDFNGQDRRVNLTGEALFQIHKNLNKPFVIKSGKVLTAVLGTTFIILSNSDSTLIDVVEGKVSFSADKNEIILMRDQSAVFINEQKLIKNRKMSPNALSWQTHKLVFENTPIKEVFRDISRQYGVEIDTKDFDPSDLRITSTFDHMDLESVWSELQLLVSMEVSFSKGQYHITNQGR